MVWRVKVKVDANQPEIVKALKLGGCSVQSIAGVGKGCPDLLVGYRGVTYLMEVKDGSKAASARKLTPAEAVFELNWKGGTLATVKSVEEALAVVGLELAQ